MPGTSCNGCKSATRTFPSRISGVVQLQLYMCSLC